MIELAFVVCMKTMMHLCEERSIPFMADISMMDCMIRAQSQLADWASTHPDMQVTRWSCQTAGGRGMKA